jgi:glycosyltransferase involved in cell wall biosynthesis
MNILICVEKYYPHIGGAEKHTQIIAEYLVKKNYKVEIATSKEKTRKFKQLNNVKINEFEVSGNLVKGFKGQTKDYQNFLLKNNFELIIFYAAQQWSFDLGLQVIEKISCKKIFVPCGFSRLNNFFYKSYFEKLAKKLNAFDKIICFSKNYKDYHFCKRIFNKKIDVISNGSFEIQNKENIFNEFYKKKKDNISILSVANLKFNKGQHNTLRILSMLKHKKYSLFFIASNVKINFYFLFLKVLIFFSKIKNPSCEIKIITNLDRKMTENAFVDANYFIHPSKIEASPLVLFEALSCGKIYLGTNTGNCKEVIKNIKYGFISDFTNELSNKLDYFIAKDVHNNNLIKKKIVQNFKKKYSWNHLLGKYLRLIQNT